MKVLICFLFMITSAFAQDPLAYLTSFDAKIYSLKSKGVADFVVDIESEKLTKQMNDQQIFGKIEELNFRVYWTANPARLAIEVLGLPDGFKEVKEELKLSMATILEDLLPQPLSQKFPGYKFVGTSSPKMVTVQDTTGTASIPSFTLKFNEQDILSEVVGNKPIGSFVVRPVYTKESFADGKLVLQEQTTVTSENGQKMTVVKNLDYGKAQGIGVLTEVEITTEYESLDGKGKEVKNSDSVEFKNYKINSGDALKYFLGEAKSSAPAKAN